MTIVSLRSLAAASLTLTLTACPADEVLGPGDLSREAMLDLSDALDHIGSFAAIDIGPDPGSAYAPSGDVSLYTIQVEETVACPEGGSMHIAGTTTVADDETSMITEIGEAFSACSVRSPGRSIVWTFSGSPGLAITMNGEFDPAAGTFTGSGTIMGTLDVASELGEAPCEFNVSVSVEGTSNTRHGSTTGTICGHTYDGSWTDAF